MDNTQNEALDRQYQLNQIQKGLENLLLSIWEQSGDETLMGAITRNGHKSEIESILKAMDMGWEDLDIGLPSHLKDNDPVDWSYDESIGN